MSRTQTIVSWAVRIIAALILLQTLYFKFTAHPDSVYIFEQTGLGAPGRIGTGVVELITSILILIPRTAWLGSILAIGTVSGAIFFHLTSLGIEVNGDGGTLFMLATVVFVCGLIALWLNRKDIPILGDKLP